MSQYKVFICHNSEDKPLVRDIKEKLLQQGFEIWMDESNIIGFANWKEEIIKNIPQMDAIAVFLGSSGFGEWQKYEIKRIEDEISRREDNKVLSPLRVGLVILQNCRQTLREIQNEYYSTPQGWLFGYHTVDLRESGVSLEKLIKAITGQSWQIDYSNTRNLSLDLLLSERNVDYTRLRNLLANKNWREADYETYLVMLQAMGYKEGHLLTSKDILSFPCTDLLTIDRLWLKYSNWHFGFSVQKEIYLALYELDSVESIEAKIKNLNLKKLKKFFSEIGWNKASSNFLAYSSVTFDDTKAPRGHLPVAYQALPLKEPEEMEFFGYNNYTFAFNIFWRKQAIGAWWVSSIFSRMETCNL